MSSEQGVALALLAVFYIAYFVKMLKQRKAGIRTNQMGKGNKESKTRIVEIVLGILTVGIVIVEVISIGIGTQLLGSAGLLTGCMLMAIGDGVFITAMYTMRDSWRAGIPIKDKTELVTKGIYRMSRNPAFLGFDLVYIGAAIAFTNSVLVIITAAAIIALHMQILEEEKFLIQRFGEVYIDYKKQVGRYFIFI